MTFLRAIFSSIFIDGIIQYYDCVISSNKVITDKILFIVVFSSTIAQ